MKLDLLPEVKESTQPDITVFIIRKPLEECQDELASRLEKCRKIKNPVVKKKINDSLFALKGYFLQPTAPDPVSHFCLSYTVPGTSTTEIFVRPLGKRQVAVLREFNLPEFLDYTGNSVPRQRLATLFGDKNLVSGLCLKGDKIVHSQFDSTKCRTVDSCSVKSQEDITQYISNHSEFSPYLLHGTHSLLKSVKANAHPNLVSVTDKPSTPYELLEIHQQAVQSGLHATFSVTLSNLTNPKECDKLVYGQLDKEIREAVEMYRLETLWVHADCRSKFEKMISDNSLKENLNFIVIELETLEKGDIADTLLKDYGGFFGQSYY